MHIVIVKLELKVKFICLKMNFKLAELKFIKKLKMDFYNQTSE